MFEHGSSVDIHLRQRVAGCDFGCSQASIEAALGLPRERRENFNGEVELLYDLAIFRCQGNRFVECTFPDRPDARVSAVVDSVPVLSIYNWLEAQDDRVELARFRISRAVGIAYDYRGDSHRSYTVFAPGHWDGMF